MTLDRMGRLALCVLLCVAACVEPDPLYCERDQACPASMRCLLPERECVPKIELCANGVDDNDDMLIDCADPGCQQDPLCLPLPAGTGYGVLTSATTAPSCGVGTAAVGELFYTSITGQNTCTGCRCVADCGFNVQVYQSVDDCMGRVNLVEATALTSVCQDLTQRAGPMTYLLQGGTAATCKQDPTVKVTPVYSATQGRLCRYTNLPANCTTPSCVLLSYARYNPCLLLDGDVMCPSGFPTRQRWYRGVNDTRTCSCCGVPSSRTCSGSATLYEQQKCDKGTAVLSNCTQAAPVGSVRLTTSNTPTCAVSASVSGGAIEPAGPLTLCCAR